MEEIKESDKKVLYKGQCNENKISLLKNKKESPAISKQKAYPISEDLYLYLFTITTTHRGLVLACSSILELIISTLKGSLRLRA